MSLQRATQPVASRFQISRSLEMFFWVSGSILLTMCLAIAGLNYSSRLAAAKIDGGAQTLDSIRQPETGTGWAVMATSKPQVVGRIEIPAIGLVSPLLSGDDSMSLSEGAGHIPGTATPGGLGTVGIAGHRDTHFRLLRKAATGMEVLLVGGTGTYHYRVTSSEIVSPDKVSVLDIQSTPGLALITCYPFSYIGRAPKRFVVHAQLLSVAPDEASH